MCDSNINDARGEQKRKFKSCECRRREARATTVSDCSRARLRGLSSSRRRQPRRRRFNTIHNNDAKTRGGKVFRAYDNRREEDNLEEDKDEDRNVPFLYDEILYQFGEDQEEDSFDETSREDEEEEEQRHTGGLLSKAAAAAG